MSIISKIKSSALIKDSIKLSSSNLILYTLPLIVTPILSRLFEPADFGDWGIFSSTVIIAATIITGGYEYAIVKSNEQREIPAISAVGMLFSLVLLAVMAIAYYAGLALDIEFCKTFPCFEILLVYMLLNAMLQILQNIMNREKMYGVMSICNIVQGGSQALFRILFGSLIVLSFGLIKGTFVAMILAVCYSLFVLRKPLGEYLRSSLRWSEIKAAAQKYKNFPLYDAPGTLLAFAAFNLPVIILSLYFSKDDLGCYAMITQLLLLPMSFIGSAVGKVYYQQIAQCEQSEIPRISAKIFNFDVIISCLPMLFLCCGGSLLIPIFLGDKWQTAEFVAIYLSLWSMPTIISQPLLPIYRVIDKQNRVMWFNLLYFVLGIGGMFLLCELGLTLYQVIIGYAIFASLAKFLLIADICRQAKIRRLNTAALILAIASLAVYVLRVVV